MRQEQGHMSWRDRCGQIGLRSKLPFWTCSPEHVLNRTSQQDINSLGHCGLGFLNIHLSSATGPPPSSRPPDIPVSTLFSSTSSLSSYVFLFLSLLSQDLIAFYSQLHTSLVLDTPSYV